jgi:hypothetical protein
MTARATVKPPKPESKIPMGASATDSPYGVRTLWRRNVRGRTHLTSMTVELDWLG